MMFSTTFVLVIIALCLYPLMKIFYNFTSVKSYANNTVFFFTWLFINMLIAVAVLTFTQLGSLSIASLMVIIVLCGLVINNVWNTGRVNSVEMHLDPSWNFYESFQNGPTLNSNKNLWRTKTDGAPSNNHTNNSAQGPCITADNKMGIYIPSLYGQQCISLEDHGREREREKPIDGARSVSCGDAMHFDSSDLAGMDEKCQRVMSDERGGLVSVLNKSDCRKQCPALEGDKCTIPTCAINYDKGVPVMLTKCLSNHSGVDKNAECAAQYGPNYGFKEYSDKKCEGEKRMAICAENYYNGTKNASNFNADASLTLDQECAELYPPTAENNVMGVKEYINVANTKGRKAICAPNYYETIPIMSANSLTSCTNIVYKTADEQCREYKYQQGADNARDYLATRIIRNCSNPYEARLQCETVG